MYVSNFAVETPHQGGKSFSTHLCLFVSFLCLSSCWAIDGVFVSFVVSGLCFWGLWGVFEALGWWLGFVGYGGWGRLCGSSDSSVSKKKP